MNSYNDNGQSADIEEVHWIEKIANAKFSRSFFWTDHFKPYTESGTLTDCTHAVRLMQIPRPIPARIGGPAPEPPAPHGYANATNNNKEAFNRLNITVHKWRWRM